LAKNAHGLTALGAAMTLMQASDKVRADVDGLRRQLDPMLVEEVIVKKDNPFEVLDEKGVGKLMELAVKWGRSVKSDLLVGICGEHGGHRLLRQDRVGLCVLLGAARAGGETGRCPCGPAGEEGLMRDRLWA